MCSQPSESLRAQLLHVQLLHVQLLYVQPLHGQSKIFMRRIKKIVIGFYKLQTFVNTYTHTYLIRYTYRTCDICINNDEMNVIMTRINYDAKSYMRTFRATRNDIKNNNAKMCTNETCISHDTNDMLRHDAFARDNAQRDHMCVWCRRCEMIYNRAYARALRECNVRTRREINDVIDDDARNALHDKFDAIMRECNVRSRRYTRRNS